MKTTEANFKITRLDGKIHSVSVFMPTWNKVEDENPFTTVHIPLLGLKTIASTNSTNDAFSAINETIKGFCILSEKFGQGIEKELEVLGWTVVETNETNTIMNFAIEPSDFILEQIMETGNEFAELELILD